MDHIVVILLVGLVAGFAASHLVAGHGYGLIGDIVVGILGALLGFFLAGAIGIVMTGLLAEIIVAFIGAVILLAVLRLVTRRGGFRRHTT
ncbi:MAG TPA: GlsB/YeaQ/YmgE family stress response membrane protein [Candidatus Dormibacteraeota bacterium]|jgi:uncharacterized membrane protein YeaQ/YmgE (transglycosylase-associated protein family)